MSRRGSGRLVPREHHGYPATLTGTKTVVISAHPPAFDVDLETNIVAAKGMPSHLLCDSHCA